MRIASITLASTTLALTLLAPVMGWAQTAYQPPAGGDQRTVTRDQFVQRAAQMAGRRFDMIDANHTGTVTMAQIRAFRAAHQGAGGLGAGPGAPAQTDQ